MSSQDCYRVLSPIHFPDEGTQEIYDKFKASSDIYESPYLLWYSGEDEGSMEYYEFPREFSEVSWEFLRDIFWLCPSFGSEYRHQMWQDFSPTPEETVLLKSLEQRHSTLDGYKFTFKEYLMVMGLLKKWASRVPGLSEMYDFSVVWSQEDVNQHVQSQKDDIEFLKNNP